MKRPKLARLTDIAEKLEAFESQVSGTTSRLQVVIEQLLALPDAPNVQNIKVAAMDLIALMRALMMRRPNGEGGSEELMERNRRCRLWLSPFLNG